MPRVIAPTHPLVPAGIRAIAALAAVLVSTSCGGGPRAIPCTATSEQPRCDSAVNRDLDLMAWTPQERANVGRLMQSGAVVVRYDPGANCDAKLETISGCTVRRTYAYAPYSAKESKRIESRDQLFAALPVGAASLAGNLSCDTSMRTDFDLAGTASLPPEAVVMRSDLEGPDCARATHVLGRIYVGGFALVSGAKTSVSTTASVFGAGIGGESASSLTVLQSEGSADACEQIMKSGAASPLCAVPLRVGLVPVLDGNQAAKLPVTVSLEKGGKLRHMGRDISANYGLVCADGEVAAGVWGEQGAAGESRNTWIWKFGLICAPLTVSRAADGTPRVGRGTPRRISESVGMGGAKPWETICPDDEFLTSLSVEWRPRFDDGTGPEYIGHLAAFCGKARITNLGGTFSVTTATDSHLTEVGTALGGTRVQDSCADGKQQADGFISSLTVGAGNLLEVVEAGCSVPKVSARAR